MANGNRSAAQPIPTFVATALVILLLALVLALGGPGTTWAFDVPQLADAPQAITWSGFTPTGWVTATPFSSGVTAQSAVDLAPETAAYATSTDGGVTWTAWDTTGLTVVAGDTPATQILNVTGLVLPDAATTNRIRFQIAEAGGTAEISPDYTLRVDTHPPLAPTNLQASPATWTSVPNFSVTWTNPPDAAAIVGAWYKLGLPPNTADDGTFVASSGGIIGIVPATDGAHPLYIWLQDELGRRDHTATATATLYLDRLAPLPPSGLVGQPARTWTNVNRFSERWTNPPEMSGIVGIYYQLDRPGAYPTDGVFVSTTTTLNDLMMPGDGKHDLYIWLVDAAGNVDHRNRNVDPQVFWYDGTPPTSSVTLSPTLAASGWYSTPVTAVFTGTDGLSGSGLAAVFSQVDNRPWSTQATVQISDEGRHQITFYARDVAGNVETPPRTLSVSLDFNAPTVTLTPDRPPQASGWYTAAVTLTLAVSDTVSGSPQGYYRLNAGAWQTGSQIRLTSDGESAVDYYAQDAAGNRSPVQTARVKLDVTPPTTAYQIEGQQGQNGWYISPLTVRLVPTDRGSGVTDTRYRINDGPWQRGTQFQLTSDGYFTLLFYSEDAAGNIETSYPVQLKLDTAAPIAPIAVVTTPAGWSQVNRFSVQWANPTDLSGIAGVYYRLDIEPSAADDGTFAPLANRLDNLVVPGEGIHRLYLWLADGAGNADHRNLATAPLLRYDATPPTTTLRIQGLAGNNGWYRSAVTVTLDAADASSGVATTRYRLNGGAWVATPGASVSFPVASADKHVLEYASEDAAGNVEATRQITLRIDPNAPAAPLDLRAGPVGWQHYNSFWLNWREPLDQSGIAGAFVRFDTPPVTPIDGQFYAVSQVLEGLQTPGEGQHDLYVWLQDQAGNSDHRTAVALPSALWYDGLPPVTTVTVTGTAGRNGWYIGPVTFAMTATDTASGLAEIRWQVDNGAWIASNAFSVTAEGEHVVRIASVDGAGNSETPRVYQVNIDRQPPRANVTSLNRYRTETSFMVGWSGADPLPGSGLAGFDVQVRHGLTGTWADWLTATSLTSVAYQGLPGHSYAFRVRARDQAGNVSAFSSGDAYTVIEIVQNGSFDAGVFSDWSTSGLLRKAVVPTTGPAGGTVLAARLGTPEYGPSVEEPGQVPVGNAAIAQTVVVPSKSQVTRPTLSFWYRIFSYDVLYSARLQRYVDDMEVWLYDTAGEPLALLLRDGNPTEQYGALYDSGWRFLTVDLSQYAGQTVQLVFANYNREDNLFNTWSFVDQVQVQDWPFNRRLLLPLVSRPVTTPTTEAEIATGASESALPMPSGGRR